MKTIAITIKERDKQVDVAVPAHVPLADWVPALCERLGWYRVDDGFAFTSTLLPSNRPIEGNDSLDTLGVLTGEILQLKVDAVITAPSPVIGGLDKTIVDRSSVEDKTVLIRPQPAEMKGSFLQTQMGATFPIQSRSTIIGRPDPPARPPDVDLTDLDTGRVTSRRHAQIWQVKDGEYWLRDLRSTNGLFVDGKRVRPGGRTRLRNGCQIQFGENGPILTCYLDEA